MGKRRKTGKYYSTNYDWANMKESARKSLVKAFEETIADCERDAKADCKEVTGEMRESIYSGVKVKEEGVTAFLKSHDKGAFAKEYGHGTAAPDPFMRTALEKNKDGVEKRFKVDD